MLPLPGIRLAVDHRLARVLDGGCVRGDRAGDGRPPGECLEGEASSSRSANGTTLSRRLPLFRLRLLELEKRDDRCIALPVISLLELEEPEAEEGETAA